MRIILLCLLFTSCISELQVPSEDVVLACSNDGCPKNKAPEGQGATDDSSNDDSTSLPTPTVPETGLAIDDTFGSSGQLNITNYTNKMVIDSNDNIYLSKFIVDFGSINNFDGFGDMDQNEIQIEKYNGNGTTSLFTFPATPGTIAINNNRMQIAHNIPSSLKITSTNRLLSTISMPLLAFQVSFEIFGGLLLTNTSGVLDTSFSTTGILNFDNHVDYIGDPFPPNPLLPIPATTLMGGPAPAGKSTTNFAFLDSVEIGGNFYIAGFIEDGGAMSYPNDYGDMSNIEKRILYKLDSSGAVDTTFGPTNTGYSFMQSNEVGVATRANKIEAHSTGVIIGGTKVSSGSKSLYVEKYNLNGALDISFGTGGMSEVGTQTANNDFRLIDMVVDGTNIFLVSPNNIYKLDANGSLVGSFATSGVFTTENTRYSIYDVEVANSRIYIAGRDTQDSRAFVMILDQSGTPLDEIGNSGTNSSIYQFSDALGTFTIPTDGSTNTEFYSNITPISLGLQSDDDIIVSYYLAGPNTTRVVRLNLIE